MEKEKTYTTEELLKKLEQLENSMKEKDEQIKTLTNEKNELAGKVASAKVDGLVRKVEETTETKPADEEITFDFDF